MVGSLKEFPNADIQFNKKELSTQQYTEIIFKIFDEINHMQYSKTGSLLHRKPHGLPSLLCKSGPVAHVYDDEDCYTEFDIDPNTNLHKSEIKLEQQVVASPASSYLEDKFCVVVNNDETSFNRNDMDFFIRSDHVAVQLSSLDIAGTPKKSIDQQNDRKVKICWPSGSYYEGEMLNGCLHGPGTYRSTDGSVYEGNWVMSKKHGFGRKQYVNGDFYEGIWKFDVQDGLGRYTWSDGSEYCGGWKNGTMSGHGVLSWSNGDTYDGQWLNGVADGHGIYTSSDGSTFFATWRNGSKCEDRMFYSYASDDQQFQNVDHNSTQDTQSVVNDTQDSANQKSYVNMLPKESKKLWQGTSLDEFALGVLASTINAPKRCDHLLIDNMSLRMSEATPRPSTCCMSDAPSKESSQLIIPGYGYSQQRSLSTTEKKPQPGEMIHKGHGSYDLMLGLQLGIRYSVGKITPQRERKLGKSDFTPKSCISVNFPKEGSQRTPPHQSASFRWKDYCPMVFRHLRETFKIDAADYMLSICGNDALREFSSPGKSGSVFYLSQDERFIIKTLRKNEVKVLLRMLPNYYKHVQMYESTLLTRFYGLHRIKLAGGQKVRFIVMGNVVSADSWIHKRYDLKGSSQGRVIGSKGVDTNETTATLKDLDLEYTFELKSPLRDAVLEQIYRDCIFLESENIMDYSLLLGIHFKEAQPAPKTVMARGSVSDLPLDECVISRFVETGDCFLEPKSLHSNSFNLKKSSSLNDQRSTSALNLRDERVSNQLGFNMPAKAYRKFGKIGSGRDKVKELHPGYDVILYFGIIDILQEYDMGKKIEHAYKSMQYDPISISAVDPILYSRRFQSFMHDVFSLPKA